MLSAALVLTACASSAPAKTSTSTPKDDKVFHSTAEAKKAAVDASQRFWDAYVRAQNDPANATKVMGPVASETLVKNNVPEIQKAAADGRKVSGSAKAESFSPSKVKFDRASFVLEGVICVRFGNLRWLDASGNDITNPSRPDLQGIEVRYMLKDKSGNKLKVDQYGDYVDVAKSCSS